MVRIPFAEYAKATITNVGGAWEPYNDQTNGYIETAAQRWQVPPNLIKAAVQAESSGNWDRDNRVAYVPGRPDPMLPYVGIFKPTAESWGYDFEQLKGNEKLQIDAMSKGLRKEHDAPDNSYGWEGATRWYFSGDPNPNDFTDEFNKTSDEHTESVLSNWEQLDSLAKIPGIPSIPPIPPINYDDWIDKLLGLGGKLVADPAETAFDSAWGPVQGYLTEWLPRLGSMTVGLVLLTVGLVVVVR